MSDLSGIQQATGRWASADARVAAIWLVSRDWSAGQRTPDEHQRCREGDSRAPFSCLGEGTSCRYQRFVFIALGILMEGVKQVLLSKSLHLLTEPALAMSTVDGGYRLGEGSV